MKNDINDEIFKIGDIELKDELVDILDCKLSNGID